MYGFELVMYYVQHTLASFLCPLIMYYNHRFDPSRYLKNPVVPVFCFNMFSLYMRLFLIPLSAITWANLNHGLCGVDNDPFYAFFNLGKWFYVFAEVYLMAPSLTMQVFNSFLGQIIFGKRGVNS